MMNGVIVLNLFCHKKPNFHETFFFLEKPFQNVYKTINFKKCSSFISRCLTTVYLYCLT